MHGHCEIVSDGTGSYNYYLLNIIIILFSFLFQYLSIFKIKLLPRALCLYKLCVNTQQRAGARGQGGKWILLLTLNPKRTGQIWDLKHQIAEDFDQSKLHVDIIAGK